MLRLFALRRATHRLVWDSLQVDFFHLGLLLLPFYLLGWLQFDFEVRGLQGETNERYYYSKVGLAHIYNFSLLKEKNKTGLKLKDAQIAAAVRPDPFCFRKDHYSMENVIFRSRRSELEAMS